jgi:hypothetical protein
MLTTASQRCFADLPAILVPQLSMPEQFVLGACRCWDAYMVLPDPRIAYRLLAPVFTYMNVSGALCAFDRAFAALYRHRVRAVEFKDTDCPRLALDEARVLSCLACLQRVNAREAVATLRALLPEDGVRAILPPLARIAGFLEARGHRLPCWDEAHGRRAHAG